MERTSRFEKIAGGISVGGDKTTAGTLSGLFFDLDTNNYVLVSNAHVFEGEWVLQPGIYDGGGKEDIIGKIIRVSKFRGSGNFFLSAITYLLELLGFSMTSNRHDVGVAKILDFSRDYVQGAYLDNGEILFPRGSLSGDNVKGKRVWSVGRTTGYKEGVVVSDSAVVQVWYGEDKSYIFRDVIIVKGRSAGGDSGSPVFLMSGNEPSEDDKFIGLLFAGTDNYFIVCKNKYLESEMKIKWTVPSFTS